MDNTICRDFLKNICRRGARCKFIHPVDATIDYESGGVQFATLPPKDPVASDLNFCKDYQNVNGCDRLICKFLHCSKEASDEFQRTGRTRINLEMAKAMCAADPNLQEVGGKQLCREYMNNRCQRGGACKYWHINPICEQDKRYGVGRSAAAAAPPGAIKAGPYRNAMPYNDGTGLYGNMRGGYPLGPQGFGGPPGYYDYDYDDSVYDMGYSNASKRPKYRQDDYSSHSSSFGMAPVSYPVVSMNYGSPANQKMSNYYGSSSPPTSSSIIGGGASVIDSNKSLLQMENAQLQRTYDMLVKTVNDLKASNEQLLSENDLLRATNSNAAMMAAGTLIAGSNPVTTTAKQQQHHHQQQQAALVDQSLQNVVFSALR